ncbi:MAG: SDH family Clp fold serine proteinase [Vulcanimicrobiaceae bacterium]
MDGAHRSPLFAAQHEPRYRRQELIADYEKMHECRLIVLIDQIALHGTTFFQELLADVSGSPDLHVVVNSMGGDGETAIRMVRAAQSRCRRLTVIVPDLAKSAATLFAIGGHSIVMGPASDLGPVDPQLVLPGATSPRLVAAKDIVEAVRFATEQVQAAPDTYPIHASLLGEISATLLQQAKSALARSGDLLLEALRSNPDRTEPDIKRLEQRLKPALIDSAHSHGATFGATAAEAVGLPVERLHPENEQWQRIWALWTRYFVLLNQGRAFAIYEGSRTSQILTAP